MLSSAFGDGEEEEEADEVESEEEEGEEGADDSSDDEDEGWFYTVDGASQSGPVNVSQLGSLKASGALPDASFLWRAGQAGGWLPLKQIPVLNTKVIEAELAAEEAAIAAEEAELLRAEAGRA